jgi:adenylyltransferase/sulfurtransferase
MDTPLEIDVATAARLQSEGALLLDVREPSEVATCAIAGSRHIPMRQIPESLTELPRDRQILALCHHGGRSMRVTQFLRANGFTQVSNVAGGIDSWAAEIDPSLTRY